MIAQARVLIASVFLAGISIVAGQTSDNADKTTGNEITPQAKLLSKSYLLGSGLGPEERATLLSRLAQAARKQPVLVYVWSQELFQVASSLPQSWNRVALQQSAVTSLSRVDPDQALDRLGTVGPLVPSQSGTLPDDVRAHGAQTVFAEYWRQHGLMGLDRIRQAADRIGETGAYPYLAVAPIINDLHRAQPGAGESLFSEALTFYRRGSRILSENTYFILFLHQTKPYVTTALMKEALGIVVSRVQGEDDSARSGKVYRAKVFGKNSSVEVSSQNDRLLLEALSLLDEVDPDNARTIREKRPELQQASAGLGSFQRAESITFSNKDAAAVPGAEQTQLERARLDYIDEIAMENPKEALQLANSLTHSGFRIVALSRAAEGLSATDPKSAASLLSGGYSSLKKVDDPEEELAAITAVARAAATLRDSLVTKELLAKGFDLGEELFQEDQDLHPGRLTYATAGFEALGELTRIGMRADATSTLDRISALRSESLQANLLIEAAQARESD